MARVLWIVLLTACAGGKDADTADTAPTDTGFTSSPYTTVIYEDSGQICLDPQVPEGVPHTIRVETGCQCLDAVVFTACEASLQPGNIVRVDTEIGILIPEPEDCATQTCGFLYAECELPALNAGVYQVTIGDADPATDSIRLSIPGFLSGIECY